MPRFVIGTAGHVDHGKTTLVRALTGVETDRLAEEKRRGISIELGFAPWHIAPDLDATVIDVPGHRRLVHTMIAGASGIELVLMVIAANEGVMPQTREHAQICAELGIRHAVVVLTKTDLVDAETVALAEAEARELLGARFELDVVPWSPALEGATVAVRNCVAARHREVRRSPPTGHARLWVDRVIQVRGAGTVVTGTLVTGFLERGREISLLGHGEPLVTAARELRIHEEQVQHAAASTRLAVNVAIPASLVHRGDLLTTDLTLSTTSVIDAVFDGPALRRGAALSLHTGTTQVSVRVTRTDVLGEGEQIVRLRLAETRPLRGGDRFLLRGGRIGGGSLLGGATVLDASPHPRSRGEPRRVLAKAVRDGNASVALASLMKETTPRVLDLGAQPHRLGIDGAALARAAEVEIARGSLLARGGGLMLRATLAELATRARELVHDHARRAPLDRGLPLATLQEKLAERAGPEAADAAILSAHARLSDSDDNAIEVVGDVVVPARASHGLDPLLARAIERARTEIDKASVRGTSAARVGDVTEAPKERTRAILAWLERTGAAVRAGDLWFASHVIEDLRAKLTAHLHDKRQVTVAEWKELGGLPRNQAVLILEHFDRMKVTRRVGDVRVLADAS
jgi:selenocysteine-specific elongation factor